MALHPLALTPDSIPSPSDAGFPGSNLEGAVVPHMQQWMLEASRSFQGLWVTVGTRSGLGNLVNVKTSNSLYLKTQGYSSRCKLNTKSRKWSYWSAWQQTLGVPPLLPFSQCSPYPHLYPSIVIPVAPLCLYYSPASRHSAFSKGCSGVSTGRCEGTERSRTFRNHLLQCTAVDGICAHQHSQPRARVLSLLWLSPLAAPWRLHRRVSASHTAALLNQYICTAILGLVKSCPTYNQGKELLP